MSFLLKQLVLYENNYKKVMTSFKAKLMFSVMRNRHLLKGKFKREEMGGDIQSVLAFRETCEKGATRFGKIAKKITVEQEVINMITSEWLIPQNAPDDKMIFYVHGGGYVSGSCNDHRSIVSKVAANSGVKTMLFEYGLAPESPFPAAINDSVSVYSAVLEKGYKPEDIIVMGESAGGGLSLALLLALRDRNIALPKACVAISPWTDLSCSSETYFTKNGVSLAPKNSWTVFSRFYVGDNDLNNPFISPLFGDLKGLPPIFINAGDADELFDDGRKFYEKALDEGVEIKFRQGKDMVHCYPLLAPMFPEATKAMKEILDFIGEMLNRDLS